MNTPNLIMQSGVKKKWVRPRISIEKIRSTKNAEAALGEDLEWQAS